MPPSTSRPASSEGICKSIRKHLNFFRVHVLVFIFTPLIFSGIFYASNGRYHISYIDSLFNCVSAMAVCGLATVNLSSLTGWQQAILFFQMCIGNPVVVSWVMVYIRRHYFAKKFEHIVLAEAERRLRRLETRRLSRLEADVDGKQTPWHHRMASLFRGRSLSTVPELSEHGVNGSHKETVKERKAVSMAQRLTPNMIRRMDDAPKLVDPSGWISEGRTPAEKDDPVGESTNKQGSPQSQPHQLQFAEPVTSSPKEFHATLPPQESLDSASQEYEISSDRCHSHARRLSDPGAMSRPSPASGAHPMQRYETVNVAAVNRGFPRTQTVEFAPDVRRRSLSPVNETARRSSIVSERLSTRRNADEAYSHESRPPRRPSMGTPLQSHLTSHTNRSWQAKHSGLGGFPMPHEIIADLFHRFFPKLQRELTRTFTMPRTQTVASQHSHASAHAPYISFEAIVGRNSTFHMLTNEQLEELGGVEYRALNALLWLVAGYHLGIQLVSFIVIAPYMSMSKWKNNFVPPQQIRSIPVAWFSIYQVVSAYTNTGTSLVDQSMLPFQTAYPMIVFMIILILAGNTAFPVFLRLLIWIISKIIPKDSRLNETLHFLLDHPRRCFVYLFPSYQTWFLFTVLVILNCTDWFSFMVFDIGNPAIDSIPLGTRFIDGLLQAIAVRAAGFGIVVLAALAPAVKVLYVVMMYVSVYPVAMSVRSTNVYEEQSLGIFENDDESDESFSPTGSRVTVWSRYLAMHARKQLSFDMWWLALALILVCIVERGALDDTANQGWFNIFSILFELVSAYGTVGLSLGIPTENYSLSGAFKPLSKLIVCFVMIRGRHRGLPVAIDRAVMLPAEFRFLSQSDAAGEKDVVPRRRSSQASVSLPNGDASGHEKVQSDDTSEHRRRLARRNSSQEAYVEEMRKRSAGKDGDGSSRSAVFIDP